MFTKDTFSTRRPDFKGSREIATEELPAGAFIVVTATLSGLAFWSAGAGLLSLLQTDAPNALGALALLGIALGVAGAIKLLFWLSDRMPDNSR